MKLSEQFAIAVGRLNRNEDGLIESEDWERFFLHLQWTSDTKHIAEEPFGFLGFLKNKKRFVITFADGSKARMWQWTEIEPIIDTPCAWVRYRVVVEVMGDCNETE